MRLSNDVDFDAPEGPTLRLYELISGPAEQERPWGEIAELYWPGARLRLEVEREDGSVRSCDWSVDEFARDAAEHYRRAGFWENEIFRRVGHYGNIAHIFSTYESRVGTPNGPPTARGVSSVQVLRRNGQWKIAGIVFHIEQPHLPIPDEYLPPS